ncbi:MAG: GTP-binding protein [Candidatus Helarchaeota archaeon]|nr:GTP-binding protein [Candidatus Helarchaeota archaeon]
MKIAYKWKVVVIGEPTVGKTSLMLKYTEKKFNELYIPTVGVQVSVKQIPAKLETKKEKVFVDLNIWDIAGHEKFQHIRKIFYEGANAFLLLYDITNEATFEGCTYWVKDLRNIIGNQYGILIGNKQDLGKERVISEGKGEQKAVSLGLDFIETSAKTGANIENVFETLTQKLLTLYAE